MTEEAPRTVTFDENIAHQVNTRVVNAYLGFMEVAQPEGFSVSQIVMIAYILGQADMLSRLVEIGKLTELPPDAVPPVVPADPPKFVWLKRGPEEN